MCKHSITLTWTTFYLIPVTEAIVCPQSNKWLDEALRVWVIHLWSVPRSTQMLSDWILTVLSPLGRQPLVPLGGGDGGGGGGNL